MSGSSGKDDMQQQLVSSFVGSLFQLILGPPVSALLIDPLIHTSRVLLEFDSLFKQIKDHLKVLQAFMVDASHRKRNDRVLRELLARLMELIYDTENILADCRTRVNDPMDCSMMALWFNYSPSQLLFRYQTAKQLKMINVEIGTIENSVQTYGLRQNPVENQKRNARPSCHLFDESEIVGLEDDTEKVKEWILYKKDGLIKVAIVGMGGLGKTTIAQKLFNNAQVEYYFQVRVWMSVSQQFNELELLKTILNKINKGQKREQQGGDDHDGLLDCIRQSLLSKKFLIVMDDVWNIDDGWWNRLSAALPKDNGSSVIVTTRDEIIAKKMMVEQDRIHWPQCLEKQESWTLFSKIAFQEKEGKCKNTQLEDVGKDIVSKCKGLPLAIKTMAGIMRLKPQYAGDWRQVADNFQSEICGVDTESSAVMASLRLSYDALPLRLKQCVLCFSIFPEDFVIDVEQLVYWWMGEGFAYAENGKTALESANDSISELVSRCLVDVAEKRNYDGKIYSCRMHDLVRDLIIKIAEEDGFRKPNEEGNHHLSFVNDGQNGDELKKYSKLWAFLVINKPGSSGVKPNYLPMLGKNTSLRVLDLSSSDIKSKDELSWIGSLRYLTCLNLKGVVGIEELPDRFKKLRNLQLLILTECTALKTLPASIMMLKNLTVLDIGNCTSLRHLPRGLGTLTNLQVLSGFRPASSTTVDGSVLTDLENLTQLRILRLCISEEDQINAVKVNLSNLKHLQLLAISIENSRDRDNGNLAGKLDQLSPPDCLRELHLRDFRRETGPTWLNPDSLPNLEYLCFENGNLTELSINGTKTWKVVGLYLKMLPRLNLAWTSLRRAMPCLKYVEVGGCNKLTGFPVPLHPGGIWRSPKGEEQEQEEEKEDQS